jgi:hypothetical protein
MTNLGTSPKAFMFEKLTGADITTGEKLDESRECERAT